MGRGEWTVIIAAFWMGWDERSFWVDIGRDNELDGRRWGGIDRCIYFPYTYGLTQRGWRVPGR